MYRAVRSAYASRLAHLAAFLVALTVSDALAGDPPVFGYGVMFNTATQAFDFVTFPPVTRIAPVDPLVAATAAGSPGLLYAIDADASLVTVDTADGSTSLIGSLGIGPQQRFSIAADPGTGALFAIAGDDDCLLTVLYSVDSATGLATPVAPLPECVAAVAADVAHQRLYFLDVSAVAINVIDANGDETTLGNLGIAPNSSARLVIDPVSGGLFMTEFEFGGFSNSLYAIDTTSGAASFVMDIGGEHPLGAPVLAPTSGTVVDRIFSSGFDP
jgi:hypothetical protein